MLKVILILLILMIPSLSIADELTKEKKADILFFLERSGALDAGLVLATNITQHFSQVFSQTDKNVPPRVYEIMQEELEGILKEQMSSDGDLTNININVYHNHFTHEEIKQINQFYDSPIGQKLAARTPDITRQSMEAGQEWGIRMQPVSLDRALTVLREHGISLQ